ncbi:hypothetical protein JCM10207_009143 [Rhodosporidiobolus poonsookiae]
MTAVTNDYPPIAPFDGWHGLPHGSTTCNVRGFSPSSVCLPEKWGIHPATDAVHRHPVLTFLVRHETSGELALFDLGLPTNWESYLAPEKREEYEIFEAEVDQELDAVLADGGVKAEDIDLLVISHKHFDHTGNPSLFPNAHIIVGPGEGAEIKALDGQRDRVQELSWNASPTHIAAFDHSYDVWGDGSFLIVSAPGHTEGHLNALIRTDAPSASSPSGDYVLLAADCAHSHRLLTFHPNDAHYTLGRWREPGDPLHEKPKHSNYDDWPLAAHTLERVKACHRRDDVCVVLAHNYDQWAKWGGGKEGWGVELNGWRKKGLKC